MNSRTRQRNIGIFIGILLAVTVAACSGNPKEEVISVPGGAQDGDLTMEPCTLEFNKTSVEAECGVLMVPENRGVSDSRLIALPVIRFPALGEAVSEPIF